MSLLNHPLYPYIVIFGLVFIGIMVVVSSEYQDNYTEMGKFCSKNTLIKIIDMSCDDIKYCMNENGARIYSKYYNDVYLKKCVEVI